MVGTVARVLALGVLLAVAAAPATAAASIDCRRSAARADSVLARSQEGAVFVRERAEGVRVAFACLYERDAVWRLPRQRARDAAGPRVIRARLAGRYVAYVTNEAGYEGRDEILVFDLRRGRLRVHEKAVTEDEPSTAIHGFVLKRNGSVAWIGQGSITVEGRIVPRGELEVHRVEDHGRGGNELVAEGNDIEGDSLRLRRDRRAVCWDQSGRPRCAQLL